MWEGCACMYRRFGELEVDAEVALHLHLGQLAVRCEGRGEEENNDVIKRHVP